MAEGETILEARKCVIGQGVTMKGNMHPKWDKLIIAARAVWNGPFYVGKLTRPVPWSEAFLKVLETLWRGVLVAAFCLVAVVALIFLSDEMNPYSPPSESAEALFELNSGKCAAPFPNWVGFHNLTDKEIGKVVYTLKATMPGRSSDLLATEYGTSPSYTSDVIIAPGKYGGLCWPMPTTANGAAVAAPETLIWTIDVSTVE